MALPLEPRLPASTRCTCCGQTAGAHSCDGCGDGPAVAFSADTGDALCEDCLVDPYLDDDFDEDLDGRQCRRCKCTTMRACDGGCSWVTDDLCSNCVVDVELAGVSR